MKMILIRSFAVCLAALACGCVSSTSADLAGSAAVSLEGTTSVETANAYYRWFNQLAVRKGVNVELQSNNLAPNLSSLASGRIQFAGIDKSPSVQELKALPTEVLAFPVTGIAIAVAYNQPNCQLKLTRNQLVDLFLGKIRNFSELGCPDQPITLLYRGDASAATAHFTASLAALSPIWRNGPGSGRLVSWPSGVAVQGADAMANALEATPGSIGYLESPFLRSPLQSAALQNRKGEFVRPDIRAAALSLSSISLDNRLLGSSPDPSNGYPIVNLSWMLVPRKGLAANLPAIKTSLTYILSGEGQDDSELLGYVRLPAGLRQKSLGQLGSFKR